MNPGPDVGGFVLRAATWLIVAGLFIACAGLILRCDFMAISGAVCLFGPAAIIGVLFSIGAVHDTLADWRWRRRK